MVPPGETTTESSSRSELELEPERAIHYRRRLSRVSGARPIFDQVPRGAKRKLTNLSHAQRAGIYYERKVAEMLEELFLEFIPQLAFEFREHPSDRVAVAIPDGIIYQPEQSRAFVVETKLQHTTEAYRQLTRFYLPIVRKAFPAFTIYGVEICKSYRPEIKLPVPVPVFADIQSYVSSPDPKIAIVPYSGKV